MFTLESFLQTQSQAALDTVISQIPAGKEYTFIIPPGGITVEDFVFKKGDRVGEKGYRAIIKYELVGPEAAALKEEMGRVPTLVESVVLDIQGDALDFGKGKNVRLGQLREAMNQNNPGQLWAPTMLIGVPFVGKVDVEVYLNQQRSVLGAVRKVS